MVYWYYIYLLNTKYFLRLILIMVYEIIMSILIFMFEIKNPIGSSGMIVQPLKQINSFSSILTQVHFKSSRMKNAFFI